MGGAYSTRLNCFCVCSLEGVSSSMPLLGGGEIYVIILPKGYKC